MTVYIAGPMTGLPDYNVAAFYAAELELKKRGYTVLNPATLPRDLPDNKYLPICMAMIEASDAVYMLPGWNRSQGATAEYWYAVRQGKIVKEG